MSVTFTTSDHLIVSTSAVSAYPFTAAVWFNRTSDFALFEMGSSAGGNNRHTLMVTAGRAIRYQARDLATAQADTSTTATDGVWHHACAVGTSATDRAVFLDGGGKGTNTTSTTPSGMDQTTIATANNGGLDFAGSIAHVQVWNIALSDAEVAISAAGFTPRGDSLVSWWELGGPYGENYLDRMGSLDMSATGSPSFASHPGNLMYTISPNGSVVTATVAAAGGSSNLVRFSGYSMG